MRFNSRDAKCRYLEVPGSALSKRHGFGKLLSDLKIDLSRGISFEVMVSRGWITPTLRIVVPRPQHFNTSNEPTAWKIKANQESFSEGWIRSILDSAATKRYRGSTIRWWEHELDDHTSEVTKAARAHSTHESSGPLFPQDTQIEHVDFFEYWKAFQVVDLSWSLTRHYSLTDSPIANVDSEKLRRQSQLEWSIDWFNSQWAPRLSAFGWLSRMRTAVGASVIPARSSEELAHAIKTIATECSIDKSDIEREVRDVLLVMWSNYVARPPANGPRLTLELKRLLRQEIEYAIFYIEILTGARVDFFDPFWSYGSQSISTPLIDALPRESELARRDFASTAAGYLRTTALDNKFFASFDAAGIQSLIDSSWNRSRSLRRFGLAMFRLHKELQMHDTMESEDVIRGMERIEQMNLMAMHSERVLSSEMREIRPKRAFQDLRPLVRESLNHILTKWGISGSGIGANAMKSMHALLISKAQLHYLDESVGILWASASDVSSGHSAADHLVAAFVNLVISRNYAAHHDSLDDEFAFPIVPKGHLHPGRVAIESQLLVVCSILSVRSTHQYRTTSPEGL